MASHAVHPNRQKEELPLSHLVPVSKCTIMSKMSGGITTAGQLYLSSTWGFFLRLEEL